MRKIACFILTAIVLTGCFSIDCPVKNLVYTNYELKKADGTPDTLKTDTLWIFIKRAGEDTLTTRVNALCGYTATGFSLDISYTQPEDEFYMMLRDTADHEWIDTFRIKKENYPHFESVDCKAAYFHDLTATATTHHAIDSITIHHSHVDYEITNTHLYMYLKAER